VKDAVWHPDAERELLDLHWRDAEAVAAALQIFAERGVGFVRVVPREVEADEIRLYVGKYYLRIIESPTEVRALRLTRWRA
jgi:hypothetical protein